MSFFEKGGPVSLYSGFWDYPPTVTVARLMTPDHVRQIGGLK